MKKKIRLEIVKLAKHIIADEENFDSIQVKKRVGQLLEQLTVLNYLESQIQDDTEIQQKQSLDSKSYREESWFTEPEQLPQSQYKEELVEPLIEKIKDLVAQMPEVSQRVDELLDEIIPSNPSIGQAVQNGTNELEEFAARYQQTPTFERKEPQTTSKFLQSKTAINDTQDAKTKSINDAVNKGLQVGLNDRLAFIKHLFDGKSEDYTRVLSQISTMKSYDQAATFIKGRVKPDYNYWLHKEKFSERFMSVIEKNFS
jgi:hypothetical protein